MEFCCPLCDRPFSPDRVSAGGAAAECTSCEMSVLLHRPAGGTDTSALVWPSGFAIAELASPDRAPIQLGDGLYRTHAVAYQPGLAITQELPRDRMGRLAGAIVAGELLVAVIVALVASASPAVTGCFAGALALLLWRMATTRHRRRTIRADHLGLSWPRTTWTARRRAKVLPADAIAQLYVRDTSLLAERWIPRFTLCARDRAGRDHAVTQLDTPEQAWWLEERLERQLGLIHRGIAGEYPRRGLPAGH